MKKCLMAMCLIISIAFGQSAHTMMYQGKLTDTDGIGIIGTVDLEFSIYDTEISGTPLWTESHSDVTISRGLFNIELGSIVPLLPSLDFADLYYIEISADGETMIPRLPLTTEAYAFRAVYADNANSLWEKGFDGSDSSFIQPIGNYGIGRPANALLGNACTTHVNLGIACTTGSAGSSYRYCTIGGGYRNISENYYATVAGGRRNSASGQYSVVAGGYGNEADGLYSGVLGGYGNEVYGDGSVCPGGTDNLLEEEYTFGFGRGINTDKAYTAQFFTRAYPGSLLVYGAGRFHDKLSVENVPIDIDPDTFLTISGDVISKTTSISAGGGEDNDWDIGYFSSMSDSVLFTSGNFGIFRYGNKGYGTFTHTHVNLGVACTTGGGSSYFEGNSITGGTGNFSGGYDSHVGGGKGNRVPNSYCVIAGGLNNSASAGYSAVLGGEENSAENLHAIVCGGKQDTTAGRYGFAGGGYRNYVDGDYSVIAGGVDNRTNDNFSIVGGGVNNISNDLYCSILGGAVNTVNNKYCTIAGGFGNAATGVYSSVFAGKDNICGTYEEDTASVIVMGIDNTITGNYNFIGSGLNNSIMSRKSVIVGGENNHLGSTYTYGNNSMIGGGCNNELRGYSSFIGAGDSLYVGGSYAAIVAGRQNTVSTRGFIGAGQDNIAGKNSVICGGLSNSANDSCVFIGGGSGNTTNEQFEVICGGNGNSITGDGITRFSFIGGGQGNSVHGQAGTVCGGTYNTANAYWNFIGGGSGNDIDSTYSTICGGSSNYTLSSYSTICGGRINDINETYGTIGGGYDNEVGRTDTYTAYGYAATIPGGYQCKAYGDFSFATGMYSEAGPNPLGYANNSACFNGQISSGSGQTTVGILGKSGGTFRIDHPLDPENKILHHYFVESPEMVLIYRGIAEIGSDGKATVELPDYFDALNKDPMIQLTGVGSPNCYIVENVKGNSFIIGGDAGMEVHWTVTGARDDMAAQIIADVMPVEMEKTGSMKNDSPDDRLLMTNKQYLDDIGKGDKYHFRTEKVRRMYEEMIRIQKERDNHDNQ